ncbi:hypothetical protein [Nocardia niwae]|uniref:hypothetical protein n=1 Tax=Nocardia niwae TaxID=626084 RepID=UPI0007A517AD|nr:hypothetical protein [Nocardia niwae]
MSRLTRDHRVALAAALALLAGCGTETDAVQPGSITPNVAGPAASASAVGHLRSRNQLGSSIDRRRAP